MAPPVEDFVTRSISPVVGAYPMFDSEPGLTSVQRFPDLGPSRGAITGGWLIHPSEK